MTNATVQSLFLFPQHQIDDVISSQLPLIIFGSLGMLLCMYFYIKMAKSLSSDFNSKRKSFSKRRLMTTEILCILVLLLVVSNKANDDIFFFEDVSDMYFVQPVFVEKGKPISKNEGIDFDIDVYYVRGESVTPSHMSLYGYERKTTPYLDSIRNEISVFENSFSPEGSSATSDSQMFSRGYKMPDKDFLHTHI